ncbi:AraC family transcriptional regulator [Rhizobium oryzicola]|uniref:AraC family transcriptional regulator n=1 Tax=Rhizobium oryzicola TaxID=1232668 RepID=A0ABT8STJ0_9HYPH|nr:AraC family transcriptional regulator [Rhizobium oryzicola]MDO1581744.1 AraC family transcriptional regulator [Rhizobium oryzicola]
MPFSPIALDDGDSLEGLCRPGGRFLSGPSIRNIERIEAAFRGDMFSPHRHDTYGLGLTLSGVQTFAYRGERRFSQPGNIIVLHPDEVHDGAAGTEDGLVYRMLYVPPDLIAAALPQANTLPFVSRPVIEDAMLAAALAEALHNLASEPEDLQLDDILMRIAAGLSRHAQDRTPKFLNDERAIAMAADYLRAHATETVSSVTLERLTGFDRYTLARQFRRRMGTSPHRFQIMRRLELARKHLCRAEISLADAAFAAGFADQAHFTRHFRAAYGISPGRWRALSRLS